MQAFLDFWKPITLRHTLVLGGALILAYALDSVLSTIAKAIIDELLFWSGVAADAYYYRKTKEIPFGRRAILYVPTVAWLATSVVWYRGWRAEYLPPSGFIDIAVVVFEAAFLIMILVGLGRDAAKPIKA